MADLNVPPWVITARNPTSPSPVVNFTFTPISHSSTVFNSQLTTIIIAAAFSFTMLVVLFLIFLAIHFQLGSFAASDYAHSDTRSCRSVGVDTLPLYEADPRTSMESRLRSAATVPPPEYTDPSTPVMTQTLGWLTVGEFLATSPTRVRAEEAGRRGDGL
ncbi:hypothetical protein BC829DRAFT_407687 [Chytridium lagenaria]|nr:hypothetical protein BC829DRAFT_407687 [Chytridium lagenaria]